MTERTSSSLTELKVPPEFAKYNDVVEADTIVRLEEWKRRAYHVLSQLRTDLQGERLQTSSQHAELVYAVAAFDGDDPWIDQSTRDIAQDILASNVSPTPELLETVLSAFVKPAFQSNPHPFINAETGRKLPREAGGPLGYLDFLEGQVWKTYPAIFNVIIWCLKHADARSVEKLWHLFIPPIMTCLDDHELKYKLHGTQMVTQLLGVASPDLLRRTGVDVLLLNSLKTSLTFLHDPLSPDLIRSAINARVALTELTTTEGSKARFEQLCSLLGDSIIGNIWIYGSRDQDTVQASVEAIPNIVRVLGIGTSRYLKGLVPQLVFPLVPAPDNKSSVSLKLASLRALSAVIRGCAPRIVKWKGTIFTTILKCWVDLADQAAHDEMSVKLRQELRSVCHNLLSVSRDAGGSLEDDCNRIVALDSTLFGPLLRPVESAS